MTRWRVTLVLVMIVSAIATIQVSVAFAAVCPGGGAPLNTEYKPSTNSRAVAVWGPGMYVYDLDIECGHVSSLIARNSSYSRFVEVGYYESPQGEYGCIDTTGVLPRVLAYAEIAGVRYCKHNTQSPVSGQWDGFRVQDGNQDGLWTYYWNDVDIWQSPDMGTFVTGPLENNGERLNGADSARANFDGLRRMNSNADWVVWDGTALVSAQSDDYGFKGCKDSDVHTRVVRNDDTC